MLVLVPVSLRDANAFVAAHHRRVGAKSAPFRFPQMRKTPFCSFAPPFPAANTSLVCGWIFPPLGNGPDVNRVIDRTRVPAQAQRSGLRGERRSSGMSELSALAVSEGYGACDDEDWPAPPRR